MLKFRSRTTTLAVRLADKVIFMIMSLLSFLVCYANVGFEGIMTNIPIALLAWGSVVTFAVSFILFIYSLIRFIVFSHYGQDADSPSNVVICAHDKFYGALLITEAVVMVFMIIRVINTASSTLLLSIYMTIPVLVVTFISSLMFYTLRLIYKYSHQQ